MLHEPVCYVNVWCVWRQYGGPEEGGWWYDRGECVKTVVCSTRPQARVVRNELLVDYPLSDDRFRGLNGSDYKITIDDQRGTHFPKTRPHYE